MARVFPSLTPSTRQFTPGTYPTRTYRALSGATVKRSFGNKPHSFELSLDFNNVADSAVVQIIRHYNDSSGGFSRFLLPDTIFAGMNITLRGLIQSPLGILWEYGGPPQVQSVFPGISSVSISFLGDLSI